MNPNLASFRIAALLSRLKNASTKTCSEPAAAKRHLKLRKPGSPGYQWKWLVCLDSLGSLALQSGPNYHQPPQFWRATNSPQKAVVENWPDSETIQTNINKPCAHDRMACNKTCVSGSGSQWTNCLSFASAWGQNIHHWRCRILTRFTTVKVRHPEINDFWMDQKTDVQTKPPRLACNIGRRKAQTPSRLPTPWFMCLMLNPTVLPFETTVTLLW